MFTRILKFESHLKHKSLFLLGPRQTGKSTLLKMLYPQARYINLLAADDFRELARYPESLRESIHENERLILIDEVQKLPSLLDEIQLIIDSHPKIRFILTGSSARKLKRGQANLLGGRANFFHLHPLVSPEVNFTQLEKRLSFGSLPSIINSPMSWDDLRGYVGTYLKEEIQAEGLSRSIENFSRFLDFSAFLNGHQLNYTKIGNDAGISPRTIKDYIGILKDTLVAFTLPPLSHGKSRKSVATEKFYLFDVGVANFLLGRKNLVPKTPDFGAALEHLIFLELKAYSDYQRREEPLSYWRTTSGTEVDFVVGRELAIEVKGTGRVSPQDLKGLKNLKDDFVIKQFVLVCTEKQGRIVDGLRIMPVSECLNELWEGGLF
jgi:predicted AAA+ superfamily ATPase